MFVRREWIRVSEILYRIGIRTAKVLSRLPGCKISSLRKHEQTGIHWPFLRSYFHCNYYMQYFIAYHAIELQQILWVIDSTGFIWFIKSRSLIQEVAEYQKFQSADSKITSKDCLANNCLKKFIPVEK